MLTFGEAIEALKLGEKVKRKIWDETCYLILIEQGDPRFSERRAGMVRLDDRNVRVIYSYIAVSTPDIFMAWTPTHVDMLEEDWIMI